MSRVLVIRQGSFPLDARVRREVEALSDAGHEVDVISLRRDGQPGRERVGSVNAYRPPLRHHREGALLYVLEHLAFMVMATVLAAVLHLRRPYDLVQAHTIPDTVVFASIVPRLLGARVVLDLHECMPEFFETRFATSPKHPGVRLMALFERLAIRYADHVITCTQQMKERFVERGAPPDKIDVILNAADERVFDPSAYPPHPRRNGHFTLICHGSVEERYGHDTLIQSVASLSERIPELRLQVFGDGSYLDDARGLVAALGIEDRVWFAGEYVPMPQLLEALARADAGVVAMKRDAFRDLTQCNKMFDLIAMRRPAIVSRTHSVEQYFDDDSFAWFRAGDQDDLARAIIRLYEDPALGDRLVERAAAVNEPYRWHRQRDVYLQVIEGLLRR